MLAVKQHSSMWDGSGRDTKKPRDLLTSFESVRPIRSRDSVRPHPCRTVVEEQVCPRFDRRQVELCRPRILLFDPISRSRRPRPESPQVQPKPLQLLEKTGCVTPASTNLSSVPAASLLRSRQANSASQMGAAQHGRVRCQQARQPLRQSGVIDRDQVVPPHAGRFSCRPHSSKSISIS